VKNNEISGMKIKEEGKGLRDLILPMKPLELNILEDITVSKGIGHATSRRFKLTLTEDFTDSLRFINCCTTGCTNIAQAKQCLMSAKSISEINRIA
jgi:hypothetical protein